jgi:hypothetical protein
MCKSIGVVLFQNGYAVGVADFWIFWIFNRRQPAADVKCYSKTKVERKSVFLYFMSSFAEMRFFIQKIT